jgi:hypothetical protein
MQATFQEVRSEVPLEVGREPSHESCCMDNTPRYEIIGEGQYRVLAQGWWADVEYRWDRANDDWRVMILDTNAYGRVSLFDIALAANDVIGGGDRPEDASLRDHAPVGGARGIGRASLPAGHLRERDAVHVPIEPGGEHSPGERGQFR